MVLARAGNWEMKNIFYYLTNHLNNFQGFARSSGEPRLPCPTAVGDSLWGRPETRRLPPSGARSCRLRLPVGPGAHTAARPALRG